MLSLWVTYPGREVMRPVARMPYGTMHVDAHGRVSDHEDPAHRPIVGRDHI